MKKSNNTAGGGGRSKKNKTPTTKMVFTPDENIDDLEKSIRIHYQNYLEYCLRTQLELKTPSQLNGGSMKPNKSFYFPPKIPFLDDPEKQRIFRKKYLQDVAATPEQEPLILMGDIMHQKCLETIGDRSCPSIVKQDLASFYKRKLSQLEVRKFKLISRWAFHGRSSIPELERTGTTLDQALGRLQQEMDLTINRIDRLSQEDNYHSANQRPIPATKDELDPSKLKPLYEEKEDPGASCSAIRQDDIEVYMRHQCYRNKIFRMFDKFISEVSWLPYSARFEMWEQSRIMIQDYKHETYDKLEALKKQIGFNIKIKLQQNGIIEERIVSAVVEKFIKNIKGPDGGAAINLPRMTYMMNSHLANHERPPLLTNSVIELKIQLNTVAEHFGISGTDLEIDNGHMFIYRVSVMFPTHFIQQGLLMQFDQYDTAKDNNYLTIDRIAKNIEQQTQIERSRAVQNMKQITDKESKKSTIGHINSEQWKSQDAKTINTLESLQRENAIGKSFFTFEKFQNKLKSADWLSHICFEGTVLDTIQRQSFYFNQVDQYDSLLESAFNFLDLNDPSTVNSIIDESALAHVQRAQARNALRLEKGMDQDQELENYLKASLLKTGQAQLEEEQKEQLQKLKEQVKGAEKPLNLSDPIPLQLIKAYYQMRYLKARDHKIKLLHYLNFFRSVQKRLSLDLKEIFTRNRNIVVPQDGEIVSPQFENSEQLEQIKFQEDTTGGPGNIFVSRISQQVDGNLDNKEPINFKGLKYNKQFNQQISSTCPSVPRYHVTYGRPRLYEDLSKQVDHGDLKPKQQVKRYEGQYDKWEVDDDLCDVNVYDEFGISIIYQEAMNDMLEVEEELLKVGTYYINQAELLVDTDLQEPASAIDRGDVSLHLIQQEADFQFQKVILVQKYLEAYEHCLDPLEIARLVQVISDIMVQRPRLNVEGAYFVDSYRSEISLLKQKQELLREVIQLQLDFELTENTSLHNFNELKFRLLQSYEEGRLSYQDTSQKHKTLSASEEEQHRKLAALNSQDQTHKGVTLEEMREQVRLQEEEKKRKIKEIAKRHASEYVENDQAFGADFEEALGIEEIQEHMQRKQTHVVDQHVIDAVKEMAFFSKQVDGFPWKLERDPHLKQALFGDQSEKVGVLDFFESLSTLSKVEASLSQSLSELIKVLQPENGLAVSCLERALIIEARSRLKVLRQAEPILTKSLKIIEDDFYLGNADKLMFLMKEFKAHLSPELINHFSNPILVAKLDVQNMSKFDFPRVKQKDLVKDSEALNPEQILKRMIEIAKSSVTGEGKVKAPRQRGGKKDGGKEVIHLDDGSQEKALKSPSMLNLCCNLTEVLRLREELIHCAHETDILSLIYKKQLSLVNKGNTKLILSDSINFDTSKVMTDSMNLVDFNDGSLMEQFDLPCREFDQTLKASLDMRSESCIKALMTELGVEELRAVLHYQVMQLQILQVGVLLNQQLLDGCMKAFSELNFLARKKAFVVPNSLLNLQAIISKTGEGNVGEVINREREKIRSILIRDVADYTYQIDSKKNKFRAIYGQKFSFAQLRLNAGLSTEVKLRLLRSHRIKLLHCYCTEVLKEAYLDSLKIQVLSVKNILRQTTMLFPSSPLFSYGHCNILDNFPQSFHNQTTEKHQSNKYDALNPRDSHDSSQSNITNLRAVFEGQTIFYIPSTEEVYYLDPIVTPLSNEEPIIPGGDTINEGLADKQIKDMVILPQTNYHYKQDDGIIKPLRKVSFNQAYSLQSKSFKLLNFLTLIYRVVKLSYLMTRNSSKGLDVLELEDHVLNGRPFWQNHETSGLKQKTQQSDGGQYIGVSQKIINKIIQRKKSREDLQEDLSQLSKHLLHRSQQFLNKDYISNVDLQVGQIERLIDLLTMESNMLYRRFILGVDLIADTYLEQGKNEWFKKTRRLRNQLTRTVSGLRSSEINMNQLCLQSSYIDSRKRSFQDNKEFTQIYQPYVDEQNLVPREVNLLSSMFSQNRLVDTMSIQSFCNLSIKDYAYLDNSLFDMTDEQRLYAFTNFMSLDQKLSKYLLYKGIKLGENTIKEVMIAEQEYLNIETDARHMQQVMMCWLSKADVPQSTKEYKKLQKIYKDHTILKVIEERDQIIQYDRQKKAQEQAKKLKKQEEDQLLNALEPPIRKTGNDLPFGQTVDPESLREKVCMMDEKEVQEHHFITSLCEKRAEINLVKRHIEIKLMNFALTMLKQEHSALLTCFDQAASEQTLSLYIHPEQQFANTLAETGYSHHLDVSNKLSFVQQFITRLRNRCTEVDTLTSGVGVVFSLKDFNECLQTMCRSLLKYGEQELYYRVETATIKENQYRHLLYLKDQQGFYYRKKCEHMMKEMDKLVSAKLTQRGSQILYELDISNRELRIMKDNIFLMERLMRQELRHEYERRILERENEANRYKESFTTYKQDLNNQIKEEVAMRLTQTNQELKTMVQRKKQNFQRQVLVKNQHSFMETAANRASQYHQRQAQLYSHQNHANNTAGIDIFDDDGLTSAEILTPKENQEEKRDLPPPGYYEEEAMKEINALNRFIRQYKVFTKLKEVLASEKHQRELQIQKQRLTSNECLWDQLAEAEKRENIIRQELYFAQQNLATYEKIIGKLQHQLESLQSEKLRLVQFKSAKAKQIEALETKIKDVEILENIDLQKVLEELKSRETKLKKLSSENSQFNERIDQVYNNQGKRLNDLKKKLDQERSLKAKAYDQLDNLRLEMKAIEGKDSVASSEVWKEKCRELYDICKELQKENEELKHQAVYDNNRQSSQPLILNDNSHYYAMANTNTADYEPIQSFDNGAVFSSGDKQLGQTILSSQEPTTKPSTAGVNRRLHGGQRPQGSNQMHDNTLTSGMSFPDILQETSDAGTRSPMSSLHYISGIKQQNKSRETLRPQHYLANQQLILNSSELMSLGGGLNSAKQTTTFTKKNPRGISYKNSNLQELTDDLHNANNLPIGMRDLKSVGGPIARSSAGIVFNSGDAMQNQQQYKGGNLLQHPNLRKTTRLMTSKGPRRMIQNEPSTTGTLMSSNLQSGFKETTTLRKSVAGTGSAHPFSASTTRTQKQTTQYSLNPNTSANLAAGLSIANASLPFGTAQVLGSGGIRGQPINLNINFNTTNINMNKQ